MKSDDNHADQYHSLQPFKRVESSRTALDKQVNIDNLKGESTKRIFRLLMLLAANECTRQEIFVRLTPYYNVEDIATGIASSSRRTDRMFERDIKLLEEQGFEIRKIKAKGKPTRYSLVKGSGPAGYDGLGQAGGTA